MNATLQSIAELNNIPLKEIVPLSGGSINYVFLLKSYSDDYVIKINNASKYPKMFETEAKGLAILDESQSFKIPIVLKQEEHKNFSYLLMEYIPSGKFNTSFNELFAEKLVKLHQCTQDYFGLSHHNYIGSLPQYNYKENTASSFYINQRIEPQIKLACERGYTFKNSELVFKNISEIIQNEPPSLLHGDLWNGNYLITSNNEPCLIDPAISYGSREMDLAMMQLFGGFSEEVYTLYHQIFPLNNDWKERVSLWQLYYLLVHLNLFGAGYFSQVNTIMKQYS